MTQSPPLLRTRALEIGHGAKALLPPIDLELGPGEFWAVIGRNGCGKTTWLRTLLGLLPPLRGAVERRQGVRLAYLRQKGSVDDLYPLVARDVVAMGTLRSGACFGRSRRRARNVERALSLLGAEDLAELPFRTLSEGQRQRIVFARIAASHPELALLDEPTSAMDLVAEREAFELIGRLRQQTRVTVIVVSHYIELVADHADHLLFLDRDTPVVVAGTPQRVFDHPAFVAAFGASPTRGPAS
ncbi:MAG: ATP-binding cassette domain-containing protein [Polyangiaceae bacterium]|nr:ATP-binding cassette domain-containing protein [Polyangiaceae bacterium]